MLPCWISVHLFKKKILLTPNFYVYVAKIKLYYLWWGQRKKKQLFVEPCFMCGWVFFPSIDPFSVSKHCNVFLWVELRWRQKDSTDRFTNTSYEVCLACFLIITGEIPILLAYVRYSCTVQDRDCYLKRLTLTDETRLADPHTLLLKDSLRLSDSHLTCIVKTNSPCLSSHEDVYIFQFQQATIFTATLLFQATINRNNVYTITYD